MSDERIEAVARAIALHEGYRPDEMPEGIAAERELAEKCVAALDRLRDARSENARERAVRAFADTSRWDVPTEDRDEDARAGLAALESEGYRVVPVRDARSEDETLYRRKTFGPGKGVYYEPVCDARSEDEGPDTATVVAEVQRSMAEARSPQGEDHEVGRIVKFLADAGETSAAAIVEIQFGGHTEDSGPAT